MRKAVERSLADGDSSVRGNYLKDGRRLRVFTIAKNPD
jgi:hypothetical protein